MTRLGWATILIAGAGGLLTGLIFQSAGLPLLWGTIAGLNVATVLAYGCDKHLARIAGPRIPEAVLHLLAAAGGTLGAWCGQMLFRHKTRDHRFRLVFFTIVAIQVLFILAVAWFYCK